MDDTVTISRKDYELLLNAKMKLAALERGGVDNWEWYDESLRSYYEWLEEQEQSNES